MTKKYNLTENEKQILSLIINKPGLSKANIAVITNLNKSTITYIVQKLVERNLIESIRGTNDEGRNGNYLYFNYNLERVLFIERSYNLLKVKISNLKGELFDTCEFTISNNFDSILHTALEQTTQKYPEIDSAIFAVHGRIDAYENKVKSPLFELDLSIVEHIFSQYHIKLHIENEAKVHALGLGRHHLNNSVINIQIMEGIGSGIIIHNHLLNGANGLAGEIAHTIAVPDGIECACGNFGCLELYASDFTSLQKLNLFLDTEFEIEDVGSLVNYDANELINVLEPEIKLLGNALNNLYLTLNPDEINITSRIYSKIEGFDKALTNKLNFRHQVHTEVNIFDYDPTTNLRGFCALYIKLLFKLNQ